MMRQQQPAWSRKGYVILAMVLCALIVFATTTQTWLTVELPEQPVQTADLRIPGSEAATSVTALALVALAGAVAASIAGTIARVVVAAIVLAASTGVVLASLAVSSAPDAAASSRIADAIGVIGSSAQVRLSVFPTISAVAGVLLGLSALLLLAAGRYWSRSKRFENRSDLSASGMVSNESGPGADHTEAVRESDTADAGSEQSSIDEIDSWDQLSRGKDPTR